MLRTTGVVAAIVAALASIILVSLPFLAGVPMGVGNFVAPALSAATFFAASNALRSATITARKWWLFAAVCVMGLLWLGGVLAAASRGGRNTATLFLVFMVLPAVIVAIALAHRLITRQRDDAAVKA